MQNRPRGGKPKCRRTSGLGNLQTLSGRQRGGAFPLGPHLGNKGSAPQDPTGPSPRRAGALGEQWAGGCSHSPGPLGPAPDTRPPAMALLVWGFLEKEDASSKGGAE